MRMPSVNLPLPTANPIPLPLPIPSPNPIHATIRFVRSASSLPIVLLAAVLAWQGNVSAIAQTLPPALPSAANETETILVVGEQPGPGMWKVSQGDNTLWIIGTHTPLPQKMKWRAKGVRDVVANSQEVIAQPGIRVTSKQIGLFRALTMIPAAIEARKNPDGARLKELVPPDVYQRWLVLRDKYIEENNTDDEASDIERWRPIFAALELYDEAIKKNGMTQTSPVWKTVEEAAKRHKVKITDVTLEPEIKEPRAALKEFAKTRLDDIDCFTKTIERIESDLRNMRARGNAWATGDVELLRRTPGADQRAACSNALQSATFIKRLGADGIAQQMENAWLAAVDTALSRSRSSVAVMPITQLTGAANLVGKLRARGYVVTEPE
ncbi:MAG: TraB/GumN family protein [Burkholderiales bacterium]